MKKILVALVTLGIVVGVFSYFGDGLKPWEDGWLDRTQDKMQQVVNFGEDIGENKLPDPEELDVPKLPTGEGEADPSQPIAPQLPPGDQGFQVPDPDPHPAPEPQQGDQQ